MKFAYCRVSTGYQDHDRQKEILKPIGIEEENIFFEITSGKKIAKKRPVFEKMFNKLQSGDVVYFTEMSRMGRSTKDLVDTVDELVKKMLQLFLSKKI